jgi:tetratricopeptide (TPR) repeat protein
MGRRRLSPSEIDKTVEKIRRRYREYAERFGKSDSAGQAFDERYYAALRSRNSDLATFVVAEAGAVEELFQRAEEEQRKARESDARPAVRHSGAADRMISGFKQRIAKYPKIPVHAEANEDVSRLYGALWVIDRELWPPVDRLFRTIYPSFQAGPRNDLESRLYGLTSSQNGRLPSALERYQYLLQRTPKDYTEVEKEQHRCILEASFFLHDLLDALHNLRWEKSTHTTQTGDVDRGIEFVKGVIDDFRLRDLKPQKH